MVDVTDLILKESDPFPDDEESGNTEAGDDTLAGGAADDQTGSGADTDDEEIVLFDDAAPASETTDENSSIKAIREAQKAAVRQLAETTKRNRELEAQVNALQGATQKVELGPKPTREQFDFDEAKYDAAMDAWYQRRTEVEAANRETEAARERAEAAYRAKQDRYSAARAALKVDDFADAEAIVQATLSREQQGLLVDAVARPERLVYALGKSPERLAELAALPTVQFIARLGALEAQMSNQRTTKQPPPPARRPEQGGGQQRPSVSSNLAKLKQQAEKTGDYTAFHAEQRRQREAA